MSDKIDFDLVASLALEIGDRLRLITEYFPKDEQDLLKNAAAAAIHMALFMKDVADHIDGIKSSPSKDQQRFLDECGCKNATINSNG